MNQSTPFRTFLTELYTAWSGDRPARLAAALAYYGMFSFAPMLYIILRATSMFIDTLVVADQLFLQLAEILGPETAEFIRSMVISASQRTTAGTTVSSLVSLGVLLYAATGLFAHLKYSLNTIWRVPLAAQGGIWHFVKTRLLAFGLVLGVGLLLIVAVILNIVASILRAFFDFGYEVTIGNFLSFIGLTVLSFAILYRVLPDVEVAWRDVWLGALLSALLLAVGGWGFGFYLTHSSIGSAFEAAGALAIVLIAIYYGAQIFLFGAIFTKVYATTFGSKVEQ